MPASGGSVVVEKGWWDVLGLSGGKWLDSDSDGERAQLILASTAKKLRFSLLQATASCGSWGGGGQTPLNGIEENRVELAFGMCARFLSKETGSMGGLTALDRVFPVTRTLDRCPLFVMWYFCGENKGRAIGEAML